MKKLTIITLLAIVMMAGCKAKDPKDQAKLDSLLTVTAMQIDSLIDIIKLQQDSIAKLDSLYKPKKTNELDLPFFIGKTSKEIRNYWLKKGISEENMEDGIYNDTKEKCFTIFHKQIGKPDFSATFDKNGLCKEHMTNITFDDIQTVQGKLIKAGYKFSDDCQCWQLAGANHYWTIDGGYGEQLPGRVNEFEFRCKKK